MEKMPAHNTLSENLPMPKVGLCLGGGGGMGAYQVGVFRALQESGWWPYIKVVSGCSVGALNSIFFMNGNVDLAEYVWEYEVARRLIRTKDKLNRSDAAKALGILRKFILREHSHFNINDDLDGAALLSNDYLRYLLNNWIFPKTYNKQAIKAYAVATAADMVHAHYFLLNDQPTEHIVTVLLASSALPALFPPQRIGDLGYFVDGGVVCNVPIQPLLDEKCEIIITSPLITREHIDVAMHPGVRFIELIPGPKIGSFLNIINFSPYYIRRMLKLGYRENKKRLMVLKNILTL
jgi:NTE family protein